MRPHRDRSAVSESVVERTDWLRPRTSEAQCDVSAGDFVGCYDACFACPLTSVAWLISTSGGGRSAIAYNDNRGTDANAEDGTDWSSTAGQRGAQTTRVPKASRRQKCVLTSNYSELRLEAPGCFEAVK